MTEPSTSKTSNSKTSRVPEFNELQYEYLRRVFPTLEVVPSTSHAECMFSAGQQSVLLAIKRRVKTWSRVQVQTD